MLICFSIQAVNLSVCSFQGRTSLYMVGVVCVLGFTTSFSQLLSLSTQPENVLSGFRSRSLLSLTTHDLDFVRVSPIHLCNLRNEGVDELAALLFPPRSNMSLPLSLQPFTPKEIVGFSIGSISSVLYLCSRLPQMYTNVSMIVSDLLQSGSFLSPVSCLL